MKPEKGVVLAAGMGTRLADSCEEPKPLITVAGLPLIQRTLGSLCQAGIRSVAVVIGYRGAEVQQATRRLMRGEPIELCFIENQRWEDPNGLSLHLARSFTGDQEFILSMVDHVFDPEIITRLCSLPQRQGVTLAVDRDVDRIFDLEDATKVQLGDDLLIQRIGKQLPTYNAIDCGIFRCAPAIYPALERAFAASCFSVSAGMEQLAANGRFWGMPVDGLYWQDVDTPEMFAEAERRL